MDRPTASSQSDRKKKKKKTTTRAKETTLYYTHVHATTKVLFFWEFKNPTQLSGLTSYPWTH